MKNYLFDVQVIMTIRVDAEDEAAARAKLDNQLNNEGWTPVGEYELAEVDGEGPDATEEVEDTTQAGLYQP